jgi:DNA invertase Pin-like site-specific DNA recombinase
MFQVQLAPRRLDERLRVVALMRVSGLTDPAAVGARCEELAERVRAAYDWPVEFYFLTLERDGRAPVEEAVWLLGAGGWDVLIVEDLTRLCRDYRELQELVERCVDAGGRVISLREGFDSAEISIVGGQ